MATPDNFHLSFQHQGTDYNLDIVKGQKSDQTVLINGVTYTVLGDKEKSETVCKILGSFSLDSISTEEDLKNRLSLQEDKAVHDVGVQILLKSETKPIPQLEADFPEGSYLADENHNIQFFTKDGHFFEIGIGHPDNPTECLLLEDGSFKLKDLPLTLKYDRAKDSVTIEENGEVSSTLKSAPLSLEEMIGKIGLSFAKYYVFPDVGEACNDYLHEQLNNGTYAAISDPKKLCEALTEDLQKISQDLHVRVVIPNVVSEEETSLSIEEIPTIEDLNGPYPLAEFNEKPTEYKSTLDGGDKWIPYEVQTGILKDNTDVGYVDFRGDIRNCKYMGEPQNERDREFMIDFENRKEEIIKAVNNLQAAKTIIIDLRNCGGGHHTGAQLVCSLFLEDKPLTQAFYRDGTSDEVKTLSEEELPKNRRLLDQSLIVLIGPNTFSAAETVTNDMRVFNRATVIGEKSGGGANTAKRWFNAGEFAAYIPEGEVINPIQKERGEKNWEGKGIEPDVPVAAADALDQALAYISKK